MLDKLLSRDATTPADGLLARFGDVLGDARSRLDRARHDAWLARNEGQVRLWTLQTRGLERARTALDDAPDVLAGPLRTRLEGRLQAVTAPPVDGYADMNVKQAGAAIATLDLVDLERIARFERATKDRKTVYAAIERRREQLSEMPQRQA